MSETSIPVAKVPDFLELLLQSIVERVKSAVREDLTLLVADAVNNISVESIDGLERFVEHCIEENDRNLKIDAENIEDLDKYINDCLKNARIDISID